MKIFLNLIFFFFFVLLHIFIANRLKGHEISPTDLVGAFSEVEYFMLLLSHPEFTK